MTAQGADDALLRNLVDGNHILFDQGIVDAFGHLSARDPRHPDRFWMSRALAPGLVAADDIVEYDLDGNAIDARGRRSYVERYIHAEAYRARADVMAVVHSHSPAVLPFGVSDVRLRALAQLGYILGEDGVPVFDAAEAGGTLGFLINTPALGKALAQTLGNGTVVLMRAHGDTVVGRSVRAAVWNAVATEQAARLQMQAVALGGAVKFMSPQEIRSQQAAMSDPNATGGEERTWTMWVAEAERHLR